MRKVYYDSSKKKHVVDVSGIKPESEIIAEFHLTDPQIIEIDDICETTRVVDGRLVKYDYVKEAQDLAAAQKAAREKAEADIKLKLGMNATDFDNLKKSIGG